MEGARREGHGWGREDGGERDGRRMGGDGAGLGMEDGGAWVEGSATEGAWVGREARGVGAGREDGGERDGGAHEDGGERDGRRMGGEGKKEGSGRRTWVWTGLEREDGGE